MKELTARVSSALVLAVLYVFVLFFEGWCRLPLFILVIVFSFLALSEFYRIASSNDLRKPQLALGFTATFVLLFLLYVRNNLQTCLVDFAAPNSIEITSFLTFFQGDLLTLSFVIFFLMMLSFFNLIRSGKLDNSLYSLSVTIFGVLYTVLPLGSLLLLVALPNGPFYALLATWATAMTDIMGYFFGKSLGRHKINFAVSPNKTWEGYVAGIGGQVLLTFLFYYVADRWFSVPKISYLWLFLLGVAIAFTGILGDLSESLLKRDAAIKDSGNLIPGHGGVLDRIDSLLFTIPLMYYIVLFGQRVQIFFQ